MNRNIAVTIALLASLGMAQLVDSVSYMGTVDNATVVLGTSATATRKYCLEVVSGWRPMRIGKSTRLVYDSSAGQHGAGDLVGVYGWTDTIVSAGNVVVTGKTLCLDKTPREQNKVFFYVPTTLRRAQADTLRTRIANGFVYYTRVVDATERARIAYDDATVNDRPIKNVLLLQRAKITIDKTSILEAAK